MTARMEVKYRCPLTLGEEPLVTAEVTRDRGRRLEAEPKSAHFRARLWRRPVASSCACLTNGPRSDASFLGADQARTTEAKDAPSARPEISWE
jgi:hypothetical protein